MDLEISVWLALGRKDFSCGWDGDWLLIYYGWHDILHIAFIELFII